MKITKSRLKEIVREELMSLNERSITDPSMNDIRRLEADIRSLQANTSGKSQQRVWDKLHELTANQRQTEAKINEIIDNLKRKTKVFIKPLKHTGKY